MLKETDYILKLQLFSFKKKNKKRNIYAERILKCVSKLYTGVTLGMFASVDLKCLEDVYVLLKGVLALLLNTWIATSTSFIIDK